MNEQEKNSKGEAKRGGHRTDRSDPTDPTDEKHAHSYPMRLGSHIPISGKNITSMRTTASQMTQGQTEA